MENKGIGCVTPSFTRQNRHHHSHVAQHTQQTWKQRDSDKWLCSRLNIIIKALAAWCHLLRARIITLPSTPSKPKVKENVTNVSCNSMALHMIENEGVGCVAPSFTRQNRHHHSHVAQHNQQTWKQRDSDKWLCSWLNTIIKALAAWRHLLRAKIVTIIPTLPSTPSKPEGKKITRQNKTLSAYHFPACPVNLRLDHDSRID